jgi:hypothetical protein
MARTTKTSRAADAYAAARSNPYVQRVIEDEELRQNLREAFESARHAYGRIAKNGKPARRLMDDKKVQRDLRSAADSLREASEQLRAPKRRKSRLGRLLVLGAVGVGVTLAVSESARKAVMDALFGAEEEFEYSSTTSAGSDGSGTSDS